MRLGTGNAVTLSKRTHENLWRNAQTWNWQHPCAVPGAAQVVNGNNNWATSVYGITPDSSDDSRSFRCRRG